MVVAGSQHRGLERARRHALRRDCAPDPLRVMQKILLELLNADCSYLALDTFELADGRRVISWSFRATTPQGVLLHDLFEQARRGVSPPTMSRVLEMLAVSQPDEKEEV